MKRALELVEPLPAKIEDCFAQFDKVFDSLASQLEWEDAEQPARAEAPQPEERVIEARPETRIEPRVEPPATQIALVPPRPIQMPTPVPAPPAPESPGDVLQQYERAFEALDDKLAESDGAEVTSLAKRPKRQPASDRRAAMKAVPLARMSTNELLKPKRSRRANRSLDEVFGVLEGLSTVRRRDQLAEERQLISQLLADTRQLCADLDLPSARVRVEFAVLTLENDHFDKLGSEIDELTRHIRHDLRFCSITPGKRNASR